MFGKCVTSLNTLEIGIVKQSIGLEYIYIYIFPREKGFLMLLLSPIFFIRSCWKGVCLTP